MKLFLVVILSFLVGTTANHAQTPVTAITGATLVNTNGKSPISDAVILLQNGKIIRVGTRQSIQIPKDAVIIDARGKWIIPGLVDSHVHFFQSGGLYTRPDALDLRKVVPYEKESRVAEQTFNSYDSMLRTHIRPKIGDLVLSGLKIPTIQKVYSEMTKAGLSPRTVRYAHSVLSMALSKAVELGYIVNNPCAELPREIKNETKAFHPIRRKGFSKKPRLTSTELFSSLPCQQA